MKTRFKIEGESAVYHCISRIVAGEMLIDRHAKEVMRKMLWQVAAFSGVEVLAYSIMTNHIHIMVRVPPPAGIPTGELMRRYRILYPDPKACLMPDADVLERILADEGSSEAQKWRTRLLARMHDVSEFMKTLKHRFTIWFNKNRKRFGTLWAERFKSVLIEDDPSVLAVVAAYIDLNAVRAGMVTDPADYRWSSYGEAMGGQPEAQRGLADVIGEQSWAKAARYYRIILFGKGAHGSVDSGAIPLERAREILRAGGRVPLSTLLRCRLRFITDGAILGSPGFVRARGAMQAPGKRSKPKQLGTLPLDERSLKIHSWRRLQKRPAG